MNAPRLLPRAVLSTALLLAVAALAPAHAAPGTPAADPVAEAPAALPAPPEAVADAAADATLATIVAQAAPVEPPPHQDAPPPDAVPPEEPADPTEAEQAAAAIYGNGEYNPIADPTLPEPAQMPVSYDPWEKLNRRVHAFNNVVDRRVARPLANSYVRVVPRPVRNRVSNFFDNLGQPVTIINSALQGKGTQAWESLGRFLLNSTIGLGGLFDPASRANIPNHNEDFGQTLGVWGWRRSRFVELPLFGPRTLRDTVGMVGDAPLSPIRPIERDRARVFLQGLQLVNVRVQLMAVDAMREGAVDEYALVRDAWLQRRNYQIFGSDGAQQDDLPDYLRDLDNPTVPADAMPIIPGSP